MKNINIYITEKLKIKRTEKKYKPVTNAELRKIILEKYGEGNKIIDVSDIDTRNVPSFVRIFDRLELVEEIIGLDTWNTEKVTDLLYCFWCCYKLKYLNLTGWDVSNVQNFTQTFAGCHSLERIDGIEDWQLTRNENKPAFLNATFANCINLKRVDISKWDVSCVHTVLGLFDGCSNIESVGNLKNWTFKRLTNTGTMFRGCNKLTYVGDLSNWNMRGVQISYAMFADCLLLDDIGDISDWHISDSQDTREMFKNCKRLHANVKGWVLHRYCQSTNMFKGIDVKIFKKCRLS